MACLVCLLPRLAPRPEAPGPLRTDSSPPRLPAGEPTPVKYPPPGPRQAQQRDPQPARGDDRRCNLVSHHRTAVQRITGRRARRVHPQPDRAASGHVDADRDPAGPGPPGRCGPPGQDLVIAGNRSGRQRTPQQDGGNLMPRARGPQLGVPWWPAQPAAAADRKGAPIKNTASSSAERQAAILSVRRRSGLPSRPSLRAIRVVFMPGTSLPGGSRRSEPVYLLPGLGDRVAVQRFARPASSSRWR